MWELLGLLNSANWSSGRWTLKSIVLSFSYKGGHLAGNVKPGRLGVGSLAVLIDVVLLV